MPLHTHITVLLLAGSIALCLALAIAGGLIQQRRTGLPLVPIFGGTPSLSFFAQFYTAFFIILFAVAASASCIEAPDGGVKEPPLINLISGVVLQCLFYLPFLVLCFIIPKQELPKHSFWQKARWIIICLIFLAIFARILDVSGFTRFLVETTGCPEQQDVVEALDKGSTPTKVVMLIMAVIVAPITEECCFRGFVYTILRRYCGTLLAALSSALLFGAIHTSLAQFLPLFMFGLVQCFLYEKFRTLWVPIILHMLFNGASSLLILTM